MRRRQDDGTSQRASTLELFYDLVFVFAITQVSHLLLDHLSWLGVLQSLIVLLAVYWSWNYTTWATNELDTETIPVRLLLLALMLVSLLMAVAIPQAFESHALLFAGSYVVIQIGRHLFLTFVASDRGTIERERAGRILIYLSTASVFWVAGALVDGPARLGLWLLAIGVDYGAPLFVYRVPGMRRLAGADWSVGTEHFAERFGLFIILALGESIVLTGATTSDLELTTPRILAFATAFLTTAAIWWLYFSSVARLGELYLKRSEDTTLIARDAYTFLHVLFVAGIILSAVGDELVIAHPADVLPPYEVAATAAGPAIYLLAHAVFRLRLTGSMSWRLLLGTLASVLVGVVGLFTTALTLAALLIAVLVAVILADYVVEARRRATGEPSPIERLEADEVASRH